MNLQKEIENSVLYGLLRYSKYLIEELNKFYKKEFHEDVRTLLFTVNCNVDIHKFVIDIMVVDKNNEEIVDCLDDKTLMKGARLNLPFRISLMNKEDLIEISEEQILKWFCKCWEKSDCVNLKFTCLIYGENSTVYQLKTDILEK